MMIIGTEIKWEDIRHPRRRTFKSERSNCNKTQNSTAAAKREKDENRKETSLSCVSYVVSGSVHQLILINMQIGLERGAENKIKSEPSRKNEEIPEIPDDLASVTVEMRF